MLTERMTLRDDRSLVLRGALIALAAASLAACAGRAPPLDSATGGAPTSKYAGYKVGKPYQVRGVWYYPKDQPGYEEIGIASWYGEQFHNHYTADGEVFDMHLPSAAHKTLPLPSLVEVTNLANGRTIVVRVNDRGPFIDGRVIDMSKQAATELGFLAAGVTRVRVRYIGQAPTPPDQRLYLASQTTAPKPPPTRLAPALPPVSAPVAPPAPAYVRDIDGQDGERIEASPPSPSYAPAPVQQVQLASIPSTAPPSYLASIPSTAPPSYIARPPQDEVSNLLYDAPLPAPPLAAASTGFQVQAGVFSTRANAERLAAQLGGEGAPQVEPFDRGGQTLYRVVVRGFANPGAAAATRSQAAALGIADARVVAAF